MKYVAVKALIVAASLSGIFSASPQSVAMQNLVAQHIPAVIAASTNIEKPPLWKSDNVEHFIGLSEIKAKAKGTLAVSPTHVVFTTASGQAAIDRSKIISISTGDERVETGGKEGKLVRMAAGIAVPYGAGSLLGLVTQGQVDLLTIEFRDEHDAYHGAVFVLPKGTARGALEQFSVPALPSLAQMQPPTFCDAASTQPKTMTVSTIASSDIDLPREYKVALYEQLYRHLAKSSGFKGVYRDGDSSPAASCPEYDLKLTVNTFRKGNAVLRSSVGSLGNLIASTKLKFHVVLTDSEGKPLLDQRLKAKAKGDSESLDLSATVAKSVMKKLKKQMAGAGGQQKAPPDRS
jgi:hypothetical protein